MTPITLRSSPFPCYKNEARVRKHRVGASVNPAEPSTASGTQTQTSTKIAGFDWSKLAQVGGAVGLVGGLATPVGATVWKLSGQLSALAAQVESMQRSIDEVKGDIKSLDTRVTNLALTVARIEGAQGKEKASCEILPRSTNTA